MKIMINLNSDKTILFLIVFLVSLINLCCSSSNCVDESNNKLKVLTIDKYLFKDYFLIDLLDNKDNHYYLLSEKLLHKDSLNMNYKETLKIDKCYIFELEYHNDGKYVKGGAVIDELIINGVLFWKNSTIMHSYYTSNNIKDIFIINKR